MPTHEQQLIPPSDMAPPSVKHLPLSKRIELWGQLVDEGNALVKAGLRAKIGLTGDLKAAYREWFARRMELKDQEQAAFAEKLTQRERTHGK